MKDHRGIVTHFAVVAVIVGLGIEQEIGDVDGDHQKQFALTPIHRAVGATEQQHQGRQDIEQRREKDIQVFHVGSCQPRNQKQ
ncbi:hypothetical protein D9M73_224570 [compost metagenome]